MKCRDFSTDQPPGIYAENWKQQKFSVAYVYFATFWIFTDDSYVFFYFINSLHRTTNTLKN